MKKKTLSLLLTAAVLAGTMAGANCMEVMAEEEIVLTIELGQDMKTQNYQACNETLYAAFEAENPNIKIEEVLVPDAQFDNVVLTKLAAGEPSDIIVANRLSGETTFNSYVNFEDLSDQEFVNRLIDPEIVKDSDGVVRCYQAKYPNDGMAVCYNKTLFEQYDIAVPKTWDEFLQVCQTLKDNGITPLYGPYKETWTFQILTTTAFGQLEALKIPGTFDKLNSGELKWSEVPEFTDVLNRAVELVDKGYFSSTILSDDFAATPSKMTSGEYGMMFGVNVFLNDWQNDEYEFGVFPISIVDDIEPCVAQSQVGGCLYIPKDAKNKDAAKKYIEFVSRVENVDLAQSEISYIPTVEGAAMPELTGIQEEFNETYVTTGKVVTEMNSYMTVDTTYLWELYQNMLGKIMTPEEVMEEWDIKFAELMKMQGKEGF